MAVFVMDGVMAGEPDHDFILVVVDVAGVEGVAAFGGGVLAGPGYGFVHIAQAQSGLVALPRGVGC